MKAEMYYRDSPANTKRIMRGEEAICNAYGKANADKIVRACNAHDDFFVACARLVDEYDKNQPTWDIKSIVDQARAALKKARSSK